MEVETEIKIKLTLDVNEALWLKRMTQNPPSRNQELEDKSDSEIRAKIFYSLPSFDFLNQSQNV